MANNMVGFTAHNEGPEQSYVYNFEPQDRLDFMLKQAEEPSINARLVCVYEAEGSCIGIMPERIAKVLVKLLNEAEHDPLEVLSYIGDELPQEVIEIRSHQGVVK